MPRPIEEIAKKAGIPAKSLKLQSKYVAKVPADLLEESFKNKKDGKLIVMTSITPTMVGEGQTVNTIALSMAFNKMGKKSVASMMQSAYGPLFSMKGGATGGGFAQLMPAEEINLHMVSDFHAVEAAQNMCAAVLDNNFFWGNTCKFNKDHITWHRAVDMCDRSLRNVTIGGGGKLHGVNRRTGVDITGACECMAILGLSKNLKQLRAKLGSVVVGYSESGKPITAEELKVAGAMAVVLREALNPNIVQTSEHTLAFMHTCSFSNMIHGSGSLIADLMALKLSEYAVVETGFGADLGAEKYFDIKCRQSGMKPDVAVINCSVRALKMHSGDFAMKNGHLPDELKREDLSAVDRGCSNLEKQVENLKMFGIPIVVCVNRFDSDSKKEVDVVIRRAQALNVRVAVSEAYKIGSKGAHDLAKQVIEASKEKSAFRYMYPVDMSIRNKIERIGKSMYGATEVKYSEEAVKEMALIENAKLDQLPISIAKTHLSLSDNPKRKGRPRGFTLSVENVEAFNGAGYIVARCDGMTSMPELPKNPRLEKIDIDLKTGKNKGIM